MGAKRPYGGFFLPKFPVKKVEISCSAHVTLTTTFIVNHSQDLGIILYTYCEFLNMCQKHVFCLPNFK
jgi:hypothetical protein